MRSTIRLDDDLGDWVTREATALGVSVTGWVTAMFDSTRRGTISKTCQEVVLRRAREIDAERRRR